MCGPPHLWHLMAVSCLPDNEVKPFKDADPFNEIVFFCLSFAIFIDSARSAFFFALRSSFARFAASCLDARINSLVPKGSSSLSSDSSDSELASPSESDSDNSSCVGCCFCQRLAYSQSQIQHALHTSKSRLNFPKLLLPTTTGLSPKGNSSSLSNCVCNGEGISRLANPA